MARPGHRSPDAFVRLPREITNARRRLERPGAKERDSRFSPRDEPPSPRKFTRMRPGKITRPGRQARFRPPHARSAKIGVQAKQSYLNITRRMDCLAH
jgi:hypothetical protein